MSVGNPACIQAAEDAHSASSDVTSAGRRGKFGPELQYIMQHTACSRQRRDMWVGSFFLVWNASSPIIIKKNFKCMFIFSQILPQVPLSLKYIYRECKNERRHLYLLTTTTARPKTTTTGPTTTTSGPKLQQLTELKSGFARGP